MDAVEPAAEALQHVNLMHGTKWYGNHRTTRLISPISMRRREAAGARRADAGRLVVRK
jgi:hypothetical protein